MIPGGYEGRMPNDMQTTLPPPPDYFPLAHGRYDVTAGLKALGDKTPFELDGGYLAYLEAKAASRREDPGKYFLTADFAPGLHAAIARRAAQELAKHHPAAFAYDGDRFTNHLLGLSARLDLEALLAVEIERRGARLSGGEAVYAAFDFEGASVFDFLAMQTQEDWAVSAVAPESRAESLRAIHLSFPNHWSPAEKIGKPFADVHRPVAGIEPLVKAAPSLIAMMIEKGPWERFAWGVSTDTVLNHHPDNPADPARTLNDYAPARVGAGTYMRIERQTLIGFPAEHGALFTIRTYFTPVAAIARDPARRQALASALAGMTEAQVAYKGLTRLREPLLAYLLGEG